MLCKGAEDEDEDEDADEGDDDDDELLDGLDKTNKSVVCLISELLLLISNNDDDADDEENDAGKSFNSSVLYNEDAVM